MKLLSVLFSPVSRHFLPLRSKYLPQHLILEHLKSTLFPNRRRRGIGTVQPGTDYRPVGWARSKQV